jgi:sporulation protein YqfC
MGKGLKSNHEKYKKTTGKKIYAGFSGKKENKQELDRASYMERLSKRLCLPADVFSSACVLTVTGRYCILIENYKGIMEYTENRIRVQTRQCILSVQGKELRIAFFTDEEMQIEGRISTIEYQ